MSKFATAALALGLALAMNTPGQAWDGFRRPFARLAERGATRNLAHRVAAPGRGHDAAYSGGYQPSYTYAYAPDDAPPAVEAAAYYTTQPAAAQPAAAYGGDPYGFLAILNQYRASAGLHPLAYDANLAAWASQNNAAQSRRGIGHHVNPNCFQNCGWNQSSAYEIFRSWLDSPGHRQNMLSPSATRAGIAYGPGPYWTLNAR
jgi:uncharacterized protein YkwD